MDDENNVVEVLKKLEPYFEELETRIEKLEKEVADLKKTKKS